MATLREALTQWVMDVFGAREFDGQILLRGVYFTSGTQEGTPIDRLLGSIGRTFGADEALISAARDRARRTSSRTSCKQVMIGESGLAGVNRRLELRNASVLLGAYVGDGPDGRGRLWRRCRSATARNRDFLEQVGGRRSPSSSGPPR